MAHLVGDIGGTNVRFGILKTPSLSAESPPDRLSLKPGLRARLQTGLPTHIKSLKVRDFETPAQAIEKYLGELDNPILESAVIAVATPVSGDFLDVTNNHWSFSIAELKTRFSMQSLDFVNDFTALAHALPFLEPSDLRLLGELPLVADRAKALIGPGTGLGVSGLLPTGIGWVALEGEGGHTTFPATNDREFAMMLEMSKEFGHVSCERLLSGPGLEAMYKALCAIDGKTAVNLGADQITAYAIDGQDEHCHETLELFCYQLGKRAADLALILGAFGGVYIGGGIVPKLGAAFDDAKFRLAFEQKGRMSELLEKIPTALIIAENPTLTGAAALLDAYSGT